MVFESCVCDPEVKLGYHYIPWIGQFFGICAWTHLEITSVAFGLANIAVWIVAQMPQFYKNWRLKKVEAIHPLFLTAWLLGDATNLLGCVLTQQLPFQLYTAIYFCISDVFLLSQWFFYSKLYKPPSDQSPLLPSSKKARFSTFSFLVVLNVGAIFLLFNTNIIQTNDWSENSGGVLAMRELLSVNGTKMCQLTIVLQPWEILVGDVSAWISAVLYLGSRVPQIVLNYRRKTVQGLSMAMFIMACVANTFYGVSILLQQPAFNERFYASTLAFLLGSLGTLVSSFVVLVQWWYYDYWLSYRIKSHTQVEDEQEFGAIKNFRDKGPA